MADDAQGDLFRMRLPSAMKTESTPPTAVMKGVSRGVGKVNVAGALGRSARARRFSSSGGQGRARPARPVAAGTRRVIVKARVIRMGPTARTALLRHVGYVQRDGVTREGEVGQHFDAATDQTDVKAFVDRCEDDRHHFRFIVSPEDGAELTDLKGYARELMTRMEKDLGTRLDWIAGEHHDTGKPHLHIVVRGKREDGRDLVIPRDYISHGMRERAQGLATELLGPRLERARGDREQQVGAARFTDLDRELIGLSDAGEVRQVALQSGSQPALLAQRLNRLEAMGLAERKEPGRWRLPDGLPGRLRDREEWGMREAGVNRMLARVGGLPDWSRVQPWTPEPKGGLIGRYLGFEPLSRFPGGPQVVAVETFKGGIFHYRVPTPDALWPVHQLPHGAIVHVQPKPLEQRPSDLTIKEVADANADRYSAALHKQDRPRDRDNFIEMHVRRLEALSREGAAERIAPGSFQLKPDYLDCALAADAARFGEVQTKMRVTDPRPVADQVNHPYKTFLDDLSVNKIHAVLGAEGFGSEAREAVAAREAVMVERGLAQRTGDGGVEYLPGWRETLNRTEVEAFYKQLSGPFHKPVFDARAGGYFQGEYQGRTFLGSTPEAVFENRGAVIYGPWREAFEGHEGEIITACWNGQSLDFSPGDQLEGQIGKALGEAIDRGQALELGGAMEAAEGLELSLDL